MQKTLDLRTGRPVWTAYRAPSVPATRLTRDAKADVLVVGMGISGAMIAEALTARGHSVICVDRRRPMKGSTAATTALVQFEIDQPLSKLTKSIGRTAAEQAWRRSRLSLVNLAGRIAELGIRCDLRAVPSLYLAGDVLDAGALGEEAEARQAAGLRADHLTAKPLAARFGIDRDGAILSHGNLALDPRKLTAGLLLTARERGARLCAPVRATGLSASKDAVVATTEDGPTVTAAHVVLATGYELFDMVPAATHSIVSTYAIATRPRQKGIGPDHPFVWEASDPYLYLRATRDGRVICGGEDEPFEDEDRRDALIGAKARTIAGKLGKLFPKLDTTPDFAWAGSFGTTTTGLPVIGRVPRHRRVHAVLGYGGNGITFSQIASEIVATELGGGTDADADLFAFR